MANTNNNKLSEPKHKFRLPKIAKRHRIVLLVFLLFACSNPEENQKNNSATSTGPEPTIAIASTLNSDQSEIEERYNQKLWISIFDKK